MKLSNKILLAVVVSIFAAVFILILFIKTYTFTDFDPKIFGEYKTYNFEFDEFTGISTSE